MCPNTSSELIVSFGNREISSKKENKSKIENGYLPNKLHTFKRSYSLESIFRVSRKMKPNGNNITGRNVCNLNQNEKFYSKKENKSNIENGYFPNKLHTFKRGYSLESIFRGSRKMKPNGNNIIGRKVCNLNQNEKNYEVKNIPILCSSYKRNCSVGSSTAKEDKLNDIQSAKIRAARKYSTGEKEEFKTFDTVFENDSEPPQSQWVPWKTKEYEDNSNKNSIINESNIADWYCASSRSFGEMESLIHLDLEQEKRLIL